MLITVLLSLLTIFGQPLEKQGSEGYYIKFTKIDNRVKVYVNDKMAYDSDLIDGMPDLDLRVSIDSLINKGYNKVKVELYNGSDMNSVLTDSRWEVRYEIFKDDLSLDYMYQISFNGKQGLVFQGDHEIIN